MRKGKRERDLRISTQLFDEIRSEFAGETYLFEHNSRQCNAWSVSQRIKILSMITTGKATTAHMIRHTMGAQLSEKLGISKASDILGQADIRATKEFYGHSKVTEKEWLEVNGYGEDAKHG